MRERLQLKFGMTPEESIDRGEGLWPGDRQHRVDQDPTRPDAGAGRFECLNLAGRELRDLFRGQCPARIGMAAPTPDARARRVQQHTVEAGGLADGMTTVPDLRRDVVEGTAAEPQGSL